MNKQIYELAALDFQPDRIKTLFICESPPAFKPENGPAYFYLPEMKGSDVLFATLMKALYDVVYRKDPEWKRELLDRFCCDQFFLMDVCKEPINRDGNFKKRTDKQRERFIREATPALISELRDMKRKQQLSTDYSIILIKKNIFHLTSQPLLEAGFNVLNTTKIDFPKYYRDRDTVREIRKLLKK